jgi:hypothetical protein
LSRRDTTLNELNLPLAFLSRRDNHHLAATAKMALLIAANFSSRMSRYIDSPYAIVLTGTPLENKLEELISIVQFVDQHRLGPTWKLLHEHQVKDEAGRVTGYTGLEKIGQTLAPVMIRRRKSEVLRQLPSRTD